MTLSLLLLPAVGGYWFLSHCNYTRFRVVRDSGYHVLFRSAVAGIVLYFIARAITLFLEARWLYLPGLWNSHFPAPFSLEVMLSLLLALFLPMLFNVLYSEERGAEKTARDFGDHTELLIAESIKGQVPVEISLRNRKVYIGLAIESGIGASADSDIKVIPIYSGYRDEETLDLHIVTDYLPIIWEYAEENEDGEAGGDGESWSSEEFRVVIPLTEIVSARLFDEEVYDRFQGVDDDVDLC